MSMRYQAGIVLPGYNALKVPNAPTIGTASPVSTTSLSITFTAPSDVGGGAITSYIATATRTSDGVLFTASGASSPITVTGLTAVPFTVTVVAVNAYGPSAASAASNSITPATPVPVVGSAFGGGYFAGQISTAGNGIADYNLVIGPIASAQSYLQGKTVNTATTGTSSVIDGPANSAAMNDASHPAAQFCEGRTIGGFSDWYMPAKNELEVCYYNLKPTTASNDTSAGINANAVPARASTYTAGDPAQTTATDFRSTGAEDFIVDYYWSSTQSPATPGALFRQQFVNGQTNIQYKNLSQYVRAIRRVAV
jgi:hypothetical protein